MSDYNPGRTIVRASTITGGDATDNHFFTGSLFLANIAAGVTASAPSTVAIDNDNKLVLTAGGGGGGGSGTPANPLTSVQFNNGGAFGGAANLTFDTSESPDRLNITGNIHQEGTTFISGSLEVLGKHSGSLALKILDDVDSSAIIGRAWIGYAGGAPDEDRAAFGHRDSVPNGIWAIAQKPGDSVTAYESSSVSLNGPLFGYLSFALGTTHRARFALMNLAGAPAHAYADPPAPGNTNYAGFGIGSNYFPSYPLDVSGGIRIGTFNDPMQTGTGRPSEHYITGTINHTGSYILKGGSAFGFTSSADSTINLTGDYGGTQQFFVVCTAAGTVTVNLPSVNSVPTGSMFIIKDGLGTGRSLVATINITADGSDVIDGAVVPGYGNMLTQSNPFQADQLISNGLDTWYTF